jgi:hypothetical protein
MFSIGSQMENFTDLREQIIKTRNLKSRQKIKGGTWHCMKILRREKIDLK